VKSDAAEMSGCRRDLEDAAELRRMQNEEPHRDQK
jgi:hypothetical protein